MNGRTTYILRYITAAFVTVSIFSLFFSVHPDNNQDFELFNDALISDDNLKISLASSVAITIPMLIDMTFDSIYYPNLDPLLFERAMFAVSLLIISISPLAYKLGPNTVLPRIAQIYIITNFGQNMILFYCTISVVHRYQSKYFTGYRCISLVTLFNIGETILCYFTNASVSLTKHYVLGVVAISNYVVYAFYLTLTFLTTFEIYKRAVKAKEETGFMSLESSDIISLIFLYGVMLFALTINIYTISRDTPLLTDRYEGELVFSTYCQIVLTIIMVVIPSRMVRFEVVNVKHALETKKSIARHVYHEMRTPLNIVVMGLELLSNLLAADPKNTELDEENGEILQDMHNLDAKDAELVEIMDNVMLSCGTTVEILNDMLVFEKLEGGSYTLDLHYYNLVPFVKQTLKPFLMQAKQKDIKVKLINRLVNEANPNSGAARGKSTPLVDHHCVNIDAVKMAQVIRNFLANALKFTPDGGSITVIISVLRQDRTDGSDRRHGYSIGDRVKQLAGSLRKEAPALPLAINLSDKSAADSAIHNNDSVSAVADAPTHNEGTGSSSTKRVNWGLPTLRFAQDTNQTMVRISVTDSGAGLSSADIRQLFNEKVVFNVADKAQTESGGGFGLKIAKNIALLHGGSVGATSPGLGKGATFYVDIPLHILQNEVSSVAVDSSGMVRLLGSRSVQMGKPNNLHDKSISGESNSADFASVPDQPISLLNRIKQVFNSLTNANSVYVEDYENERDLLRSEMDIVSTSGSGRKSTSFIEDYRHNGGSGTRSITTNGSSGGKLVKTESNELISSDKGYENASVLSPSNMQAEISHQDTSASGCAQDTDKAMPGIESDCSNCTLWGNVEFHKLRRILIVDDSHICRGMVRKVLQNMNKLLHIDTVCDGNACLHLFSKHYESYVEKKRVNPNVKFTNYYDVIIMDYTMPGLSGSQTTIQLRSPIKDSSGEEIRRFSGLIVGLSGASNQTDIDEFVQAGADAVLTKPLITRKLVDILKKYDQEFLKKEDLSCHEWWYLASYIFSYPIFFVSEIMDIFDATALVAEQTHVLASKHLAQKRRGGRSTLKELIVTPFFLFLFSALLLLIANTTTFPDSVYLLHGLPPLSDNSYDWGIFSPSSPANNDDEYGYIESTNLYYSPSDNAGVVEVMTALQTMYPDVTIIPMLNPEDITTDYQENLFKTYGSVEFELTEAQRTSGTLVSQGVAGDAVTYSIRICPVNAVLPTDTTTTVWNDLNTPADAWSNSGYLTIQNFINTYLATIQKNGVYTFSSADFSVDTLLQRYPKSDVYDGSFAFDMSVIRWFVWKWMAPAVITIALFTPMLSLTTQLVREKQYKMKDILEISGLYNISFWLSFLVTIVVLEQVSIWLGCGLLTAMGTLTTEVVFGYAALMTCFSFALTCFSFSVAHILDQAEYYGLPTFILNTALAVSGVWVANDFTMSMGGKLMLGFLFPPIQLATGIFAVENWSYNNDGVALDFDYVDADKALPSTNVICVMFLLSSVFYLFIAWGYPFEWLILTANEDMASLTASVRADIVPYHCDNQQAEEEAAAAETGEQSPSIGSSKGKIFLDVQDISQIYPDGTQAVKSMSFQVRDGEVLSYLGANGAGKSTTMGMLCGTLVPTFGDAIVNGHSITRDRTEARRNLGICMQQDIIWDDVSVEDHLMLFGQLRGTRGAKLRIDVDRMLQSLGFPEKAKSLAGTLSGGQKRRLCVGLAMVGGNSVVFLDEPTAGLDPVSRRQLWELIQANRNGRAILLTTHFMDEADVLGDSIAIVKEGRLRALGTSKYLKTRFGLGYLLRCSLKQGTESEPILKIIHKFVPSASIVSNAGTELAIRMPKEAVTMFADMMESLEHAANKIGVLSFGIETTTLEEVFMRIVNEDTEVMMKNPEEAARMLGASAEERATYLRSVEKADNKRNPLGEDLVRRLLTRGRIQGVGDSESGRATLSHVGGNNQTSDENSLQVFLTQWRVLLWKRRHQFDRSRGQWAFSMVVPVALLVLAAVLVTLLPVGIIGDNPGVTDIGTYSPYMTTPVSAATSTDAAAYAASANVTDVMYSGPSYESLYNYVNEQSTLLVPGNNSLAGVYFEATNNFTVMYNATTPLELPALVNQLLQSAVNDYTGNQLTINTLCEPLPASALSSQTNYGILFCFVIAIWVGSLGGGMSIVLSGERVGLVKHQQLASGTSKLTYWISNLCFDFCIMLFHVFILMICMYCADKQHFDNDNAGQLLLAGVVFTFAALFRFYVVSFMVDDVKMVQSIYFYGSLMVMYVTITVWVQIVYTANGGNMGATSSKLITFILSVLDPTFGFSFFLLFKHNFLGATTLVPGIQWTLIPPMALSAVVSMIMLVSIEFGTDISAVAGYWWLKCCGGEKDTDDSNTRASIITPGGMAKDEMFVEDGIASDGAFGLHRATATRQLRVAGQDDPDIIRERQRVEGIYQSKRLSKSDHSIFIHKLSKIFHGRGTVPTKVAVDGVSLAVGLGEVFGLLGANGAGKTTLLKIVSGLELPTTGQAYINGYNVVKHRTNAQRSMGLCPQFDTLVERLSVRENLLFFGMIKGISNVELDSVCDAYMTALNIKKYENKLIQHLSGGNRRKVSLAVALLGCPPTVYLDEPSTGLDPVASRLMWRLLSKISATKSNAIVLTTHNMLECEAVCTRIGVMKTGKLVCLGDSQHLRSVHGTGFLLEVILGSPGVVPAAKRFIEQHFPGALIVDEHSTMINYEVPSAAIPKLSVAFRTIENNKADLNIIDYALSQSTLEQVFLKQIRPATEELSLADRSTEMDLASGRSRSGSVSDRPQTRTPTVLDYFNGYTMWLMSGIIPGVHQFYLGDSWRGVKYFFTLNELYVGWLLDLFEMHILIQKRVEQYGNSPSVCCCNCFYTVQTNAQVAGGNAVYGDVPPNTIAMSNSRGASNASDNPLVASNNF